MEKRGGEVDVVVSDVVMPEMDGPTLLKELKKRKPDIKIVFVSGYAEDAFDKSLPDQTQFNFLAKPFTLKQLVKVVKETMAGGEPPGVVSRAQRSTRHKRVYARLRRAMAQWCAADTDLGFTRDRRSNARKSGKPDLRGSSQSVAVPDQRRPASRTAPSGKPAAVSPAPFAGYHLARANTDHP